MTVIDANIIIYAITESEQTALARNLLERTPDVVVPVLWRSECLSALVVLARNGRIVASDAPGAFIAAWEIFHPRERDVDYELAMRVALERSISAYDAQYLALAMQLECHLVTNDRKLADRCGDVALLLKEASTTGEN